MTCTQILEYNLRLRGYLAIVSTYEKNEFMDIFQMLNWLIKLVPFHGLKGDALLNYYAHGVCYGCSGIETVLPPTV